MTEHQVRSPVLADKQHQRLIDDSDLYYQIQQILMEYVCSTPFSNLAVLLAFLDEVELRGSAKQAILSWQPESIGLVEKFGGTNCIGAVQKVKESLATQGIEAREMISRNNGFVAEEIEYAHAALLVTDPHNGQSFLVDPGLGLTYPVAANHQITEIADREYRATFEDDEAQLNIIKPDGSQISFCFVYLPAEKNLETHLQKPLLQATTAFKIDTFNPEGYKTTSLKVDFFNDTISFLVKGQINSYDFSQIDRLSEDSLFGLLCQEIGDPEISQKINRAVQHRQDIVDIWLTSLQHDYYFNNSHLLSPFRTTREELKQRGYEASGIFVCLVNERQEVLLSKVPNQESQPQIDRYPGQYNVFVSTTDLSATDQLVDEDENFSVCLENIGAQDIGLSLPPTYVYREIDYRPLTRAQCVIMSIHSSDIDQVRRHLHQYHQTSGSLADNRELVWLPVAQLKSKWVEPNTLQILEKMMAEGLLVS